MNINLHTLLPDEMSDEAIYHVVLFFHNFARSLEDYYYPPDEGGMHAGVGLEDSEETLDDEAPF